MKERRKRNYLLIVGFIGLVMLFLTSGPLLAKALAADSDNDGFSDLQETEGLAMYDGSIFPGSNSGLSRDQRLDPLTPDLFVILRPADPSNFPDNPLEFVSRSQAQDGLGITVHVITDPNAPLDRKISTESDQLAVRVAEDTVDDDCIILGYCNQGTPNDLDGAIIYTQRIISFIEDTCSGASSCIDAGTGYAYPEQVQGESLIDLYIKHVIAHEIGHTTMLAAEYNSRFGGYHYKAGSGVIMEQAEVFTSKKTKSGPAVTFYISQHYAEPSQQGVLLKWPY